MTTEQPLLSTSITVNPSRLKSSTDIEALPANPLAGRVQFQGQQPGIVQFSPEVDATKRGWNLCSRYRSSKLPIDLEKFKDFDTKQIDELWNEVKAYLPAGAKKIRVDLGALVISYVDGAETKHYIDVSKTDSNTPEKILNLMHKVRNVAQKVWIDLRLGHNFNDGASRADRALKPLQIPSDDWKGKMPKSVERFVKDGHFDQLVRVSENPQKTVLERIMATEDYIQRLKQAAAEKKRDFEEQLSNSNFHNRPAAEQKEIKSSIDQLTQFISEIDDLDRLPLYFAVGTWGNTDPQAVTKEDRFRLAGRISEGVESTLMRSLKPGVDDRHWIKKKLGIGEKAANAILGAGPFIKTYAGDAGDLIIPEKLDYIERLDQENREERAPSLIEFVTQAMIQGNQFDTAQAFVRLKLGYTEEVNTTLTQGAIDAQKAAETMAVGQYTIAKNTLKFTDSSMQNLAAGAA